MLLSLFSKDSISLSRSCLSIGKDGPIKSLKQLLAHKLSHTTKNMLLIAVLCEYFVKTIIILVYFDCLLVDCMDDLLLFSLFLKIRLQPNKHLYILLTTRLTLALFTSQRYFFMRWLNLTRKIKFYVRKLITVFLSQSRSYFLLTERKVINFLGWRKMIALLPHYVFTSRKLFMLTRVDSSPRFVLLIISRVKKLRIQWICECIVGLCG